jgi:Cupin superfamily protein
MSELDFDFAKLISPIDPASFFRDTWEKKPLVVSRDQPDYYSRLFSVRDVDSMIHFTRPRFSGIRTESTPTQALRGNFPHDEHLFFEGENNIAALSNQYAQGKTIFVHKLEQRWKSVATLCRDLESTLHHPVNASMFLTPRNSQGVSAHFDSVEVFVLQIEGSKHWRLYKPTVELPLKEAFEPIPREQIGEPIQEVHVKPGDLIYIPRGFIHEAFASDDSSLHITVAVSVFRWADLVQAALACLSAKDVRFRRAVPVGALGGGEIADALRMEFEELLQQLVRGARVEDAMAALGDQFIGDMAVLPGAHFLPPEEIDRIELETVLERSKGMVCRVVEDAASVSIQFPGARMRAPTHLRPALEFISKASRFPVGALPGGLSDNSKLILAKRLIRDGLLTIVDDPAGRTNTTARSFPEICPIK